MVSGKMPQGKKPPRKMPPRKLPSGKLPPGNKPPKKIGPQENCLPENCFPRFCCFWHYLTGPHFKLFIAASFRGVSRTPVVSIIDLLVTVVNGSN